MAADPEFMSFVDAIVKEVKKLHPEAIIHIDDATFNEDLASQMLIIDLPFDGMKDAIDRIDETVNSDYSEPIYIYLPASEPALYISRESWRNIESRMLSEFGPRDRRFWDLLMTSPREKAPGGEIDWDYKGEF